MGSHDGFPSVIQRNLLNPHPKFTLVKLSLLFLVPQEFSTPLGYTLGEPDSNLNEDVPSLNAIIIPPSPMEGTLLECWTFTIACLQLATMH